MKAFTITSRDVYNILQSSTIDRHYTELFTKAVSTYDMLLSEYVYTCFCGYLTGYIKLNDLNLDLNEHNRIYDRFVHVAKNMSSRQCDTLIEHNNFYGGFSPPPRDMNVFDYDVLQVNIIDSIIGASDTCLFGKYRAELYDDTYDMLVAHHTALEGSRRIPQMESLIQEEMEAVVALTKFVIEQVEARILNQRSDEPTCYVLFGMHEQNVFVLVH